MTPCPPNIHTPAFRITLITGPVFLERGGAGSSQEKGLHLERKPERKTESL